MTQILGGFQILRVLMLATRLGAVKHRLGFNGNNVQFHWGIAGIACVGDILTKWAGQISKIDLSRYSFLRKLDEF